MNDKERYQANKATIKARSAKWRERNPDYLKDYNAQYVQNPLKRAKIIWNKARKRRSDGFTVTLARIEVALMIGKCERTGISFDLTPHENYSRHPFAPSLDRKDAFGPYNDDNVQVVCNAYNIGKNQMTDEEYIEFCRAVVAADDARKNHAL